jgi:DNA-binding NarL/FixJ family response regulator
MSSGGYAAAGELTPRMRAVLASAATGSSARATGRELHVSEGTVRTIRAAAIARLGVPNVTAACVVLARRGEL